MEAPPPPSSAAHLYYNHEDELAMASSVVDRLPPGFRFHPTDSEIIDHYLLRKVIDRGFRALAVAEVDLNKSEPWDLPQKAKIGEDVWWFFFEKESKYPTGMRTNRATPSGYWKATGKDKGIYRDKKSSRLVGMKKTLVFYKGRAPKGEKTNWVIHEYRLHGDYSAYNLSSDAKEKWVVSKVTHKKSNQVGTNSAGVELARVDSFVNRYLLDSPTPLTDYSISKPTSTYAAHQFDSSTLMLSNYTLQELQHLLFPNEYSATQMDEDGPSPLTIPTNLPPTKGAAHNPNPNSRIAAPDICIGPERMCKLEDSEVVVEGLGFNPNIVSDLDSLWSYATEY